MRLARRRGSANEAAASKSETPLRPVVAVAEDWCLEHPLRYLLEPDLAIHAADDPKPVRATRTLLVGWAGGAFLPSARRHFRARG